MEGEIFVVECEDGLVDFGVGMVKGGVTDVGLPSFSRSRSERRTEEKSGGEEFFTLGIFEVGDFEDTLGGDAFGVTDLVKLDWQDLKPICGMNFVVEMGFFHCTILMDLEGGRFVGFFAQRLRRDAMSWMACLVLSVIVRDGKVEGGADCRRSTMSDAALLRWSERDVSGTGTVDGRNVTVSVMRTARVFGTKHWMQR